MFWLTKTLIKLKEINKLLIVFKLDKLDFETAFSMPKPKPTNAINPTTVASTVNTT